jgi:C-terminal processing protease CtpA/Prc
MLYARLEHMLPRLWWLEFGDTASVEITVRDTARKLTAIELSGAPVMDIERRKGSLEVRFHSREFAVRDDHIAYLRPGAFGPQNEDDSLQKLENWLANAFAEIEEQDVTDLIVDLRNNPGGDSSFSDPLIAHIADEPFHFASRFDVRASAEVAAVLQELAATEREGVSAQMLKLLQTTPLGETFEFRIPEVPPAQRRFTGKVWAFVNRHSYSNATVAAAIIQDYGFGLVTGEETADLPTSLASSAKFTLPHSGIAVTFPKARFVRPSGNEDLRGVIPDIPLSADQLKADTVPDMLVKHIQQQGSRQ